MPDAASGPGCERHRGDPHNLCQACWALEPDPKTPDAMEARAAALVEYGNSLPDGVTTEAFAEAANLRREARELRQGSGPNLGLDATEAKDSSSAAYKRELGVFEQMDAVKERLAAIRSAAERVIVFPLTRDESLWLVARIEAVLAAVTDAQVTYGIIDTEQETTTPMFTERDAIVRALYTGGHRART